MICRQQDKVGAGPTKKFMLSKQAEIHWIRYITSIVRTNLSERRNDPRSDKPQSPAADCNTVIGPSISTNCASTSSSSKSRFQPLAAEMRTLG